MRGAGDSAIAGIAAQQISLSTMKINFTRETRLAESDKENDLSHLGNKLN